MASIIVTYMALDPSDPLADSDFKNKLAGGMRKFGHTFNGLFNNPNTRDDAYIETFYNIENEPDYHIYAISPTNAAPEVFKLSNVRYSDDESKILFKVQGKARRFKLHLRDDKKYSMNAFMPIFKNPLDYLGDIVDIVQNSNDGPARRILLANSLISRCK